MTSRKGTLLERNIYQILKHAGFSPEMNKRYKNYEIDVFLQIDELKVGFECKQYERSSLIVRNLIHQWDSKNKILEFDKIVLVLIGIPISSYDYQLAEKYNIIIWNEQKFNKLLELSIENKIDKQVILKDLEIRSVKESEAKTIKRVRQVKTKPKTVSDRLYELYSELEEKKSELEKAVMQDDSDKVRELRKEIKELERNIETLENLKLRKEIKDIGTLEGNLQQYKVHDSEKKSNAWVSWVVLGIVILIVSFVFFLWVISDTVQLDLSTISSDIVGCFSNNLKLQNSGDWTHCASCNSGTIYNKTCLFSKATNLSDCSMFNNSILYLHDSEALFRLCVNGKKEQQIQESCLLNITTIKNKFSGCFSCSPNVRYNPSCISEMTVNINDCKILLENPSSNEAFNFCTETFVINTGNTDLCNELPENDSICISRLVTVRYYTITPTEKVGGYYPLLLYNYDGELCKDDPVNYTEQERENIVRCPYRWEKPERIQIRIGDSITVREDIDCVELNLTNCKRDFSNLLTSEALSVILLNETVEKRFEISTT